MDYNEILNSARKEMGGQCAACVECDGVFCKNHIPGPGAKGTGDTAIRNYNKWKEIRLNLDTICENKPVDTKFKLFGKEFKYPFFAAPVGDVTRHYGSKYDDAAYNSILVSACARNGIAAFTGDALNDLIVKNAAKIIAENNGTGISVIKPWDMETVYKKLEIVKESGAFAAAMDVDAAGLPFLKGQNPPAGSKSIDELRKIIQKAGVPFMLKGIMTVKGALKAVETGAAGIIVSNHGGRVLDQCPATAEVLEDIVKAVKGKTKIFVDGGIRSGVDVLKALALGADAVLICRPFVPVVYGAAEEGAAVYIKKIGGELEDAMAMCGVHSLSEITRDCCR